MFYFVCRERQSNTDRSFGPCYSNRCQFGLSSASREEQKPCIHFFADVPPYVAACDDNEYEVHLSGLLEAMKTTILPTLLRTTIKGRLVLLLTTLRLTTL